MFKAAVGHGIDPDSIGAIAEAIEQCQQTLVGKIPQAGILMAAIDFDHASILEYVQKIYPGILLIGGTSVGEMSSSMAFQQDSLTLMLFCSDDVTFRVGVGHHANEDPRGAATAAIDQVLRGSPTISNTVLSQTVRPSTVTAENMKLCYTLCDGLGVDGAALVKGLRVATNQTVPIFGGFTGDDYQFTGTYQFMGGEVLQNAVVVLTFSGDLNVSYGVATGQRPIGRKSTVTKSNGYTIHAIDGKPAKAFYADCFGDAEVRIYEGSSFSRSIAVFEPGEEHFYLRSPNGEANEDGSINFFGSVPEQATVQLVDSDCESLIRSAEDAFSKARFAYPGEEPDAVLLVSCVSRMKNLGTQVHQEYSVVEDSVGNNVPNIGFYAYGEMSPFTEQPTAYFHNETFAALLIGTR
ncbi:MAG: FIST N-terminal domain-containing protein [Cyanobacteria bacterium J06650_10]